MRIAVEPLLSKKLSIVRIIKVFDDTIAPGLVNGDEHRLNVKVKAEPDHHPHWTRIFVAAAETQFIIELQKIW